VRYRRDIPLELVEADPDVFQQVARHIAMHLLGAADPDDDPTGGPGRPLITLYREDDLTPGMVSLIGETDAAPNAPYLRPGFDPGLDHPEIEFIPHENPDAGQHYDQDAYLRWLTHGHHERSES
jgi:hypothetical protein